MKSNEGLLEAGLDFIVSVISVGIGFDNIISFKNLYSSKFQ